MVGDEGGGALGARLGHAAAGHEDDVNKVGGQQDHPRGDGEAFGEDSAQGRDGEREDRGHVASGLPDGGPASSTLTPTRTADGPPPMTTGIR